MVKHNAGSVNILAAATAALLLSATAATAQTALQCADSVPQDPTAVYRSGLWKQWFYWMIPGPSAYAAVKRIVAESNVSRASAGLPLLVTNPANELVLSVFDERNARGAAGSSALPTTVNREAFLATFVDDTAGNSEVFFLTDPLRSNDILTTTKGVAGLSAIVEYEIELSSGKGVTDRVHTEWEFSTAAGDKISFSARYPGSAIYFHSVTPASRVAYANCNLVHTTDIIYRTAPNTTYPLFAREEANFIALDAPGVEAKIRVKHHDPDVNAIFNDPANLPELMIGSDRDVRIEKR